MTRFDLHILGCGSAKPTLQHQPSCQVLDVRDNLLMIDCGEGAQLEWQRHRLKFSRLNHIFLSHLHGDHCFGLPGLLSSLALTDRTGTLTIHTFEQGAEFFTRMMREFCHDMPFEVRFNVIDTSPAVIWEDDAVTVRTVPLRHSLPTVGFVVTEKPKLRHIRPDRTAAYAVPHHAMNSLRQGHDYVMPDGTVVPNGELTAPPDPSHSYAYCSDTAYSEAVADAVRGVEWLYHEATYGDGCELVAKHRGHATARQAAEVARRAGVRQLVIGHFSSRYDNTDELVAQAREVFANTRAANEGMVIDLNNP